MTATIEAQISGPYAKERADSLVKAIKKIAKGSFLLENVQTTDNGITLSYRLKKQYTFRKDLESAHLTYNSTA
jgi:hypothetical protein